MMETDFFQKAPPMTVAQVAELVGGRVDRGDGAKTIAGIAPLSEAGDGDLSFLDNPKYLADLAATGATACLVADRFVDRVPQGVAVISVARPYHAFATAAQTLYPTAARLNGAVSGRDGSLAGAIDPAARLEDQVTVEPGAVIGPAVQIGSQSVICANAVIGAGVRIGRDCYIGPNCTLTHALVGDGVIIHAGVAIGQDGFGFAMGAGGHLKVPQIGRVIIQDKVEIGANTTIDRGANRDTIIGEGTKIDNQVQIAHNVEIGRHCVIVAQAGISGSTTLEDYVVLAGKAGIAGHLRIGAGAQIAGGANVADDVPPQAQWGGTPARPIRQYMRELARLKSLAKRS